MVLYSLLRFFPIVSVLLSGVFVSAHVEDPRPEQYCAFACYSAVDYLTFNTTSDASSDDYYTALCSNTLKITSIYYCAQEYCSEKEARSGLSLFGKTCQWEASITPPPFASITNSSTDISAVQKVPEAAYLNGTVFYTAVIPDHDFFKTGYDTTYAYYSNIWLAYDFAYAFYAFWGLAVLAGAATRLAHTVLVQRPSNSKLWPSVKRNLILPATFGSNCQKPIGWCTVPPRLESIVLAVYVVMNLVFCFPGYNIISNNLYWPASKEQLTRYISDRCGILAIANLPLVWLFATRNSPLLWITGWHFATFNRFHRWVARLATALAIAHGVGHSVSAYYLDYYIASWPEQYWYCGVMALCCMSLILVASVYYVRRHHYELFLNVHIFLAVVCTAALFFHVKIFSGMYNGFIWPCVAIWVFDRLLRLSRIIHNTVLPRIRSKTTAIATYDKGSDTIRLDVTDYLRGKTLPAGSYYYIYAPSAGVLRAYESHPFTLCSWSRNSSRNSSSSSPSPPSSPAECLDFEKTPGATIQSISVSDDSQPDEAHSFIIRPHSGMTRRLRDKIQSSPEASACQLPLLLEGPYGAGTLDPAAFSDVLAVVGGVGICEAVTLAHRAVAAGSTVRIAWAVRQSQLVEEVCANELGALLAHPRFRLSVFCTQADGLAAAEKGGAACEVRATRPDVEAEMRAARQACGRRLAVVTCGPDDLADRCRRAAVRLLCEDGAPMDYFGQSLGW